MNCPNCAAPNVEGDSFCAACGAPLARPASQPVPQPAPHTAPQPAPQPAPQSAPQPQAWQATQPMPQVPPAPGTYAPPPAQTPPPPMAGYAQTPPTTPAFTQTPAAQPAPGYGQPIPPKKGLGAGAIIGIVIGALALLGILVGATVLVVVPMFRADEPEIPQVTTTPAELPTATAPAEPGEMVEGVYEKAMDAAAAEVPGDYVLQLAEEGDEKSVYWAGPPNSEWDTVITVSRVEGGWKVSDTAAFDESGDGGGDTSAQGSQPGVDEAAARQLVADHLTAIKEDRPQDAQKLTISPFRDDPASAQYSNGNFKKFAVDEIDARSDGTFLVTTTQTWSYGTESWRYEVVPTEAGLRIRDLQPAQ